MIIFLNSRKYEFYSNNTANKKQFIFKGNNLYIKMFMINYSDEGTKNKEIKIEG